MDKVQIYSAALIGTGLLIDIILDGKEIPLRPGILRFTINMIICLPIYGRIFGVW
jgi:hypothetical protein